LQEEEGEKDEDEKREEEEEAPVLSFTRCIVRVLTADLRHLISGESG